jgi:hypothetical protein
MLGVNSDERCRITKSAFEEPEALLLLVGRVRNCGTAAGTEVTVLQAVGERAERTEQCVTNLPGVDMRA